MLSVIEGLSYRKIREFRKVWRRDEGVPPYRSGVTPAKSLAYTDKILAGRRLAVGTHNNRYIIATF